MLGPVVRQPVGMLGPVVHLPVGLLGPVVLPPFGVYNQSFLIYRVYTFISSMLFSLFSLVETNEREAEELLV